MSDQMRLLPAFERQLFAREFRRLLVGVYRHGRRMSRMLRGTELRYVLTAHLARHGPATVPELVHALTAAGFAVRGRPSKTVSDALRWEIGRGRVWRIGRGRYRFAEMPRSTEYRIYKRVEGLRAEVRADAPVALSGHPPRLPAS